MKSVSILPGTLRIGRNLHIYEKTSNSWRVSKEIFPEVETAVKLFKAHGNFRALINKNNPSFLKGQLSPDKKIQGARINILPNGEKIDKAYSLFAKNLMFHDQKSNDHWDVIYQNPNGKFAYCYTIDKKNKASKNKYRKVKEFASIYPTLEKKVEKALKDKQDILALPMYTLLKTYMRVGNEMHFRATGHKGLTTLTKRDVKLNKNKAVFNYISKSGVPMEIVQEFPEIYISRLKNIIQNKKPSDFVFTHLDNKPLKDTDFMKAFENYCGQRFYPHIVRSFYATSKAEEFLATHKSAKKEEVKELFTTIAEKLGHKRFDKKQNEWKDSYTVTIHHYIQPDLVEKLENLIK
ncbi:MAG: hypothetical protein ACP5NS_00275 [Candidatus Pacearchaeota archaeon]